MRTGNVMSETLRESVLDELHGYILAAANDKRPLLVYAHYRKIEVISDFRKIYYSIEKT